MYMECRNMAGAEMGSRCMNFVSKNSLQALQTSINRLRRNGDSGRCGISPPYVLLGRSANLLIESFMVHSFT